MPPVAARISIIALVAVILLIRATAAPVAAEGRGAGGVERLEPATLEILTRTGRHRFTVEVARTARQHARGLMFRRRLAPDRGMLFLYRTSQPVTMWMKNTFIPLDMLFVAADGRIVRIAQRTVPHSIQNIPSGGPVSAVLEVNGGTAERLGIRTGDRIVHPAFAP